MKPLAEMIPHTGSMCLLERVVSHSDSHIECATHTHRDPANPLRRGDQLSVLHLIEYAAQATAIHGALHAEGQAQPGMLASVRNISLLVDAVDTIESELRVTATQRVRQDDGALYDFQVTAEGQLLCEGRVAIAFGQQRG